jgi:hypothetical protein
MKENQIVESVKDKSQTNFPIDKVSSGPGVHKNIAYALQFGVDKILGDVLTVIDTMGLPQSQDKAIKQIIKEKFWNRYRHTADYLLNIVFELDRAQSGGVTAQGYMCFGPNAKITNCGELEEE